VAVATSEGEPRLRLVLHDERHMGKALQHEIVAESKPVMGLTAVRAWQWCGFGVAALW
jgi:hypothetical protein